MLKRSGILLLAALFGFATLQSASAQDEDDEHEVEIEVEDITELEIDEDVTLEFDAANGTQELSNLEAEDAFASDDGSTNLTLSTNENSNGNSLQIDGTFEFESMDLEELGLHVDFDGPGSDLDDDKEVTELDENFSGVEPTLPIVEEFGGNYNEAEIDITYEGAITEDFDPNNDEDITVTYTVTE